MKRNGLTRCNHVNHGLIIMLNYIMLICIMFAKWSAV
jgi:hypothetical protein